MHRCTDALAVSSSVSHLLRVASEHGVYGFDSLEQVGGDHVRRSAKRYKTPPLHNSSNKSRLKSPFPWYKSVTCSKKKDFETQEVKVEKLF